MDEASSSKPVKMLKVICCLNVLVVVGGFRSSTPTPEPENIQGVVAIQIDGVPKCLGAFVAAGSEPTRFIATAAHCVYGVQTSRLNFVNSGNKSPDAKTQVKRVIIHPYYTPPSSDYDIALLKTVDAKPGLSLYKNVSSSDTILTAFSWDSEKETAIPIEAALEDRKSCRPKMANHLIVSTRMLCANFEPGSAVMDGSPLVRGNEAQRYIVGVGSYYVKGGSETKPKIFTNVANSEIYSFIDKYID